MSFVSGDDKINLVFLSGSCLYLPHCYSPLLSLHSGAWWWTGTGLTTFDGNSVRNLWSVPSATWVDIPNFMLIASISCQHPNIIHRSYSSLHVWRSAFLTWWFVEWRCGQVPWIRLCLWWVEMSKLILCFWVVLAYTYLIATLLCFLSILVHDGWLDLDSLLLMGTLEEICRMFLLQRELTCQVLCWLLAFHANTLTLFTALILLSILVHDGGLELGSLLFDGNSEGNLWSVPSATWVDMPTFKLNASMSCQHPHIIHRSYSSLHSGAWWWTGTGLSTFWWELWRKSVECAFCNVSWHANFYVDC